MKEVKQISQFNEIVSTKNRSPRLFENNFMETLTHVKWFTPFVFYIPIASYCFYQGIVHEHVLSFLSYFILGLLLWTLVEYLTHRFIFHFEINSTRGKKMHYIIHGFHHAYPQDETRTVLPLVHSIPIALLYTISFYFVFRAHFWPAITGFGVGYILYELAHYLSHFSRSNFFILPWLRKYHMKHHFLNDNSRFGFTSPLWDIIFRTNMSRNHK